MSLKVFSKMLKRKIPEELFKNSIFGPFKEIYKGNNCIYYGGYKKGKRYGFGKMVISDGSYIEGVFNGEQIGKLIKTKFIFTVIQLK